VDDGDYYLNYILWGHNDDYNALSNWNGLSKIMDVMVNYDPQPDNLDHDYCWNIYEFIDGWRHFGYPVDSTFINIFEAHNIPVFIPGDANDNNFINILDVTFLISYLYKGGPEPPHRSSADVNASCSIDLIDITYLIEYFYDSGSEPLSGCVNYYPN
ncbi:MAG: dockerin type I domain-containing protein, partial [Candidatus Zixiibacteriota bacterium]